MLNAFVRRCLPAGARGFQRPTDGPRMSLRTRGDKGIADARIAVVLVPSSPTFDAHPADSPPPSARLSACLNCIIHSHGGAFPQTITAALREVEDRHGAFRFRQ